MLTRGTPVRVTLTTTDTDCGISYLKALAGLGWAKSGTSQARKHHSWDLNLTETVGDYWVEESGS